MIQVIKSIKQDNYCCVYMLLISKLLDEFSLGWLLMKFFYENKDLSIRANYGDSLAFGAHLHNHIELAYMLEGRTRLLVDSKEYIVNAGDAFIIFPNQIHQYQKIDHEKYFLSIFPTDLCPEFQNIFKNKLPVSPVIEKASENKKILPLVDNIIEINMQKGLFYNTCIKGCFLILLSELFQMMQFEDSKSPDSNTIKDILNYCSRNYSRDIQLETVSKALHISKYYISHLFSQKLLMSFSEYIGTLRISDACRLLTSEDMSITEIAFTVGFNSTRSFNRVFLKYTGMTPRQYKKIDLRTNKKRGWHSRRFFFYGRSPFLLATPKGVGTVCLMR